MKTPPGAAVARGKKKGSLALGGVATTARGGRVSTVGASGSDLKHGTAPRFNSRGSQSDLIPGHGLQPEWNSCTD